MLGVIYNHYFLVLLRLSCDRPVLECIVQLFRPPGHSPEWPFRAVLGGDHSVDLPMAAVAAPELEIDQRHIAAAGIDQPLQVGISRSQARKHAE